MITYGGRFALPLATYHGVPAGWSQAEVVDTLTALNGNYPIDTTQVTEPSAPTWLPDRANWLQYRSTLYQIASGARAGNHACIELAIRYIEARPIGSYSGFIRARLARSLRTAPISDSQIFRLNRHFLTLVQHRDYTEDFAECAKLWSKFASEEARLLVSKITASPPLRKPKWTRHFYQTPATPNEAGCQNGQFW